MCRDDKKRENIGTLTKVSWVHTFQKSVVLCKSVTRPFSNKHIFTTIGSIQIRIFQGRKRPGIEKTEISNRNKQQLP